MGDVQLMKMLTHEGQELHEVTLVARYVKRENGMDTVQPKVRVSYVFPTAGVMNLWLSATQQLYEKLCSEYDLVVEGGESGVEAYLNEE